jgi:hypothetical protein
VFDLRGQKKEQGGVGQRADVEFCPRLTVGPTFSGVVEGTQHRSTMRAGEHHLAMSDGI